MSAVPVSKSKQPIPAPQAKAARRYTGRRDAYLPGPHLNVHSSCRLHSDAETSVDPITYEVIRSHLWNVNLEHGDTIKRVSGSPLVVFSHDFNQSIHTESGDPVAFGPSIQHFTGLADLAIKWTLENRSANPGIHEGDIFLHNDPWVGANHQMDVTVFAPVFIDGRLFCWVLNVAHARDIGGANPGSWVPQADDMFAESQPIPPMRIAVDDVLLADFEDMYTRKSRLPELCALELRSQIAGVLAAKRRVLALAQRYGAATVKGVMAKMIGDCERVVRSRLAKLPDGEWTSQIYFGSTSPGNRSLGRQVLTMTKRGERLSFSNAGTDPQGGSTNCTAAMWRAAIFVSATSLLAYDQYFCAAGVLRCLDFDPLPGLRNSCSWPGAVTGGVHPQWASHYQATNLLSRLFACDNEAKRYAMAPGAMHTLVSAAYAGRDASGRSYSGSTPDVMAGTLGAFSFRDGISSGGVYNIPLNRTGDVEMWEANLPLLCLYRREASHGGHGRWRGGAALATAYMGHRTGTQRIISNTAATSVTGGPGLWGGYPGPGGGCSSVLDSGIRKRLAAGELPGNPVELRALPAKVSAAPPFAVTRVGNDDVWETFYCSGAGYGDPLLRDPAMVQSDLDEGMLDAKLAERIYGAALDRNGRVDAEQTKLLRTRRMAERLRDARFPGNRAAHGNPAALQQATLVHAVGEMIDLVSAGGARLYCCRNCRTPLASLQENFKAKVPKLEVALPELDPAQFRDPHTEIDGDLVLRKYLCPGCGVVLDADITRPEDEPLWDMKIANSHDQGSGRNLSRASGAE